MANNEQYVASAAEVAGVNQSRAYYVAAYAGKIAEWAQLTPSSIIVDVPCGTGGMAKAIHEDGYGARFTMVDINPTMLEAAKQALPGDEHTFIRSDAADIAEVISADSVDAVMCLNGLHNYISRQESFMSGVLRVLRPGGRLVVDVSTMGLGHPHSRQYLDRHDELMREMAATQGSSTNFPPYPDETTLAGYADLITDSGFTLIGTEYDKATIPIARFNQSMVDIPGRLRSRIPDLPNDESRLAIFLNASRQAQQELGITEIEHSRAFFVAEKP